MAIPTSYTEEELKAYMHSTLSATATSLNWNVADGYYNEPVIAAVLAYDVDDIEDATDMQKLRALARREAWRAVMAETSTDYDYAADGASLKRSQMHDHAEKMFRQAQSDLMALGFDGWEVGIEAVEYDDPYKALETDT